MTPDNPISKQLIETFNIELDSLLTFITNHLKKIEETESTIEIKQQLEEIARLGRNIKVSALSVGIVDLGKIAEGIEKLFTLSHKTSPEIIHLAVQAVDGMREIMQNFVAKRPLSSTGDELLLQLQQQVYLAEQENQSSIAQAKTTALEKGSPITAITPNTKDNEFAKKIIATFKVELEENAITITNDLLQLEKGTPSEGDFQNLLAEIFRMAHNIKGSARGIGATDVSDIAHHIETLFAALQKKNIKIAPEVINLCLQSVDYMNEAMRCFTEGIPLPFDLKKHLLQLERFSALPSSEVPPLSQPIIEKPLETPKGSPSLELPKKIEEFESIRIALENLDRISAYMEEIQATKIAIEEYYAQLVQINFKMDYFVQAWKKDLFDLQHTGSINFAELSEINIATHLLQRQLRIPVSELSILLNALEDEIRTLRLIPVASQLRFLPRIVRDLAHELNKQVNFEIKSNEVKIDKMVLDGLKDPIIHLLRNAIDHGIESPQMRQAAGKSPSGTIVIEVNQKENQIVFKISDDGAGIKTDDLLRVALQKNLITQTELDTMKQDDVYELIFRPGFSTREIATDISGRGVGLDVVRSNLLHLKGQVSLKSQPGKGTDFFLQVPLTLATEHGLIISCSSQFFVFITRFVENVLLLKKQDILTVEGSQAILVKEQPILLCSLSDILRLNDNKQNIKEPFSVVVIKKDLKRIALLVDEIIGEREIILKPLQEPLTHIPCIIGATLTGSNQINFVLNAEEIIRRVC